MWHTVQCAVQGRGHIKEGIPCQDKTYSVTANGVQVIALADGAGSAKLSHFGADAVTKYICSNLSERFDEYYGESNGVLVKQQLLNGLKGCLSAQAELSECELKDLASTLLFVAIKDDRFVIAHIGDGVIGYLKNGRLRIASQPENGEFVNTTVFTTSEDAIMSMRLIKGRLGEIRGFVLMSDGTEAGLYSKKDKIIAEAVKKVMWLSLILPEAKVEELLRTSFETVVNQATTDDCSIVLITDDQNVYKGYMYLPYPEKCTLLDLGTGTRKTAKQIRRYDDILASMQTPQSVSAVARRIRLKPKYAKKHIDRLCAQHLIEKEGPRYRIVIEM